MGSSNDHQAEFLAVKADVVVKLVAAGSYEARIPWAPLVAAIKQRIYAKEKRLLP